MPCSGNAFSKEHVNFIPFYECTTNELLTNFNTFAPFCGVIFPFGLVCGYKHFGETPWFCIRGLIQRSRGRRYVVLNRLFTPSKLKYVVRYKIVRYSRGERSHQKPRHHLEILGSRKVTWSKIQTQDQQTLSATVQCSGHATWRPSTVHFYFTLARILSAVSKLQQRSKYTVRWIEFQWQLRENSSLNLCTGRPPTGVMIPDAV